MPETSLTPYTKYFQAAQTERHVLELVMQLEDPDSWLYQQFYGSTGVTATRLEIATGDHYGHDVLLKNETRHTLHLGNRSYDAASFKRRGALLAGLLSKRANPNLTTFVAASHGNHGIGVVMAAKTLGVHANIYCPESVNDEKLKKLRSLGAVVHSRGLRTFEDAMTAAILASTRRGYVLIHPFDQPEVIAGQATIGLEIVRDLLGRSAKGTIDLHTSPIEIYVAVAGGGLLSGVSIVLKRYKDLGILGTNNVQLFGAQMVGCDAARRSVANLHEGGNGLATFAGGEFNEACDSTAVREVGRLTLPFMANSEYVQGFHLVSEAQVAQAMKQLSSTLGRQVEPAGALAYAAAKQQSARYSRATNGNEQLATFITPVCGSNVTAETVNYFQASLRNDLVTFK